MLHNMLRAAAGNRGTYALSFDGINDYVQLGSSTDLRLSVLSLCGWAKTGSNQTGWIYVKKSDNKGGYQAYGIALGLYQSGAVCVRIQQSSSPSFIDLRVPATFNDNLWHHYALTYDGTTARLYMDGVEIGSATGGAIYYAGDHPATLGAELGGSGYGSFLDGVGSDTSLRNIVLTASEIQDVMNSRLTGAESGLVGYWRLDEGEGTTATDSAGVNDGTLVNGPTWVELDSFPPA